MRFLVVEKDTSSYTLQYHDDRDLVVRARTAEAARSCLHHEAFDLVMVNLLSLGEAGFDFIRQMRLARHETPLIALTGRLAGERVRALGLGADEAIALPVEADEMRARVRAVARRHRERGQGLVHFGGLSLSRPTHEVWYRNQPITVTPVEYAVLELLALRKGQVVTKDMLMSHLYGGLDEPPAKIIDVFICKLRRKLAAVGADGMITTVWGRGYAIHTIEHTLAPRSTIVVGSRPPADGPIDATSNPMTLRG